MKAYQEHFPQAKIHIMPKTKEIPSLNDNQKPTSLLNEMDALDRINELFFGKKKNSLKFNKLIILLILRVLTESVPIKSVKSCIKTFRYSTLTNSIKF